MERWFVWGFLIILAYDGFLMALFSWMVQSQKFSQYRIRTPTTYRITKTQKAINISLNGLLSLSFFAAVFYHLHEYLMYFDQRASAVLMFGEVLGSLLLYDFMYYFLHRGMHHPKVMKYVHGVHHYARFPTSPESIYLHPAENLAGLALLLFAVSVVGPISAASLLLVLFIHQSVNILVHCNLVLPHPAFRLINFWATKHDFHHGKHLNKNYASIFPFWDQMFGTYR